MSRSPHPPTTLSSTAPRAARSDLPSVDEVSQTFSLAAPRVPRDLADSIAPRPWWASLWVWSVGAAALVGGLMYALGRYLGIAR